MGDQACRFCSSTVADVSYLRSASRLSAVFLALGLVASACGSSDAAEPTSSAGDSSADESAAAPANAEISNITSETFDITTYEGEDTLFWFWAPW